MWKIGNKDFQLLPQDTQFQEDHKFRQKSLIIVFFFLKNFRWNIANVFWVVLFLKKCWQNVWETRRSVFRLEGFAQATQPLVCLHILFSKL